MKGKRSVVFCLLGMLIIAGMSGCGNNSEIQSEELQQEEVQLEETQPEGIQPNEIQSEDEPEFLSQVELGYMTDEATQEIVRDAMRAAGISDARQQVFFSHVDQFNVMAKEHLTEGFQTVDVVKLPLYDPYELQDAWSQTYPDLFGYNCRITAYSLMADFIQVDSGAEKRDDYLAFDLHALDMDSSAMKDEQERDGFRALFSAVPTDNTQDVDIHVKNIQEVWKKRGISFDKTDGASMISVFLHDQLEENDDELFIGHAGVLLEQPHGELLFVEKVAFQEPYQVIRLANRTQLNDYLMGRYDISYGQETVSSIIFENDKLLEGYRVKLQNTEKEVSESLEASQEIQEESLEEINTFFGMLEEKKDFMFIITNELGESYPIGFENPPKGYEELQEGNMIIMEYTGELSVADSFTGEIISLKRASEQSE